MLCRFKDVESVSDSRGGRSKQLLNDIEETRRYCKLKEEALDHILWRYTLCRFQDVEFVSDFANKLLLLHFNFLFQKQSFQRRLHKDWVV